MSPAELATIEAEANDGFCVCGAHRKNHETRNRVGEPKASRDHAWDGGPQKRTAIALVTEIRNLQAEVDLDRHRRSEAERFLVDIGKERNQARIEVKRVQRVLRGIERCVDDEKASAGFREVMAEVAKRLQKALEDPKSRRKRRAWANKP